MAPAVLTIGVGVPGAQGPQGPAGQGVPAGGTSGQYLQKTSGADYATDWVTVNLAAYAVKANNLSDLTNFSTARSNLGLGTMATATAADYSTTTVANGLYYPLTGNPSSFLTASALTGYATESWVTSGFATTARGLPASGTVGQVLTKNSGTNYDSSWQTLIPGDRYLTASTTSLTIDNNNKTLTIGTGLSYSSQQDIVITHDAANHMHARVLTYNSGTGVMDVDVLSHSGAGTYATWTVNVGGAPALASVVWGDITGTLGNQTDLATALNSKLEVTTAASTYQTISGMSDYLAKAGNLAGLSSNSSARTNLGLGTIATVNDAPSDGSTYGRNNGAWVVASGGSFPADALTTDEVNAVANASIPNYAGGTSSTLNYSSGLFTFYFNNPDPEVAGGYVNFISDSSYSFTVPSGTIANWEIRYPSGTGETIANLVSWFNSNYSAYGSIYYAGDDTQSIDGLGGLSSSAFVFQQNTVGSSDTFLISGYIKSYLDKMFFDTSGWQAMTFPVLGVSFPGVSKFLDLNNTFRQLNDATFSYKIIASAALNLPHGFAPSPLNNGDIWTTSSGLFARINNANVGPFGPGTDYRAYTTAGSTTWTKPAGAKWVEIIMFGGGGGGGSGGRYATTSNRTGAGGGAGGPILIAKVAASALNATETVVVGAGGTGGPSTLTDTTLGTSGGSGGSSSFSIFTAAGGGGGAGGGNIGSAAGGLATVGWVTGVTGASSTAGGAGPATNTAGANGGAAGVNSFVATGGGSGSGNVANNTASNNGGNGGQKNASNTTSGTPLILGGTAGTTAGVLPTTGVAGVGLRGGGTGGGGGAYRTAQAGMAGAVGAAPGGGGGGGSASDNGFASGAGGAGGVGAVYIITYC
jgi:hypothetical protein